MAQKKLVGADLKNFYNEFRTSMTESQFKKFKSLNSSRKKILFIANLAQCFMYPTEVEFNHGKSIEEARVLKNEGNLEFQKKDYNKALWFYSQAILKSSLTHPDNAKEAIVFFANRSASLYHLQEYELAIKDIEFALKNDYPPQLSYKLLDRKARSLLALKKLDLAVNAFRLTITALDGSRLSMDKRQKWQKDIQIMLIMLEKEKQVKSSNATKIPKTSSDTLHLKYEAIKPELDIKFSEKMGRFAQANSDIKPGDIVLEEDAHCAVLLEQYQQTHCNNCFVRVKIFHPCPTCDQIIFCSNECAQFAVSKYHQTECAILRTLWKANISITCLMALRMITQHPVEFFLQNKKNFLNDPQNRKVALKSSNYEAACTLVSHEDKRKPEDMLNRIYIALFLLDCLKKSQYYFNNYSTTDNKSEKENLSDDEVFIAQLLLGHLQILQFNAHEVSELVISPDNLATPISKFIGGALYPTLALFNHSCNPGLVRYFKGTKVIARAIRNISAGEMVAENYGPLFVTTNKEERQKLLKERYWFTCECEACHNNWPTLTEMNNTNLRLRCSNIKCSAAIILDPSNEKFFITCTKCFKNNNILKALKVLKETDNMFNEATNYMKSNYSSKALKIFLKILNLLDETILLPSKDFHMCQEEIRICYLEQGNR